MLKNQQDSEDALQDTYRKALRALPTVGKVISRVGCSGLDTTQGSEIIRRRKRIVEMPDTLEDQLDTIFRAA